MPCSRLKDMAELDVSDVNLRGLEALRRVISEEDGQDVSLDEALARVLKLYREFVPYN